MTEEEKRALLEGARGEVIERALGEAQHDREAAMLRRERDEARAQVKAWQDEELERRRERDEARAVVAARWALAREAEELLGIAAGPAGDDRLREGVEAVRRLRSERDEARAELDHMRQGYDRLRADRDYHCDRAIAAVAERDEARAQLAALWSEVHDVLAEPHAYIGGRERSVLTCAVGAIRATAEAHDRRVRAEALRDAAACLREHAEAMASGDRRAGVFTAVGMIGARADEIEGGER